MTTQPTPTSTFADRVSAARSVHGPLVAGLDPAGDLLETWGLGDDPGGLERFVDIVVGAFNGVVGFVKPQSAFYERHGWEGIRALSRLIDECRSAGLMVIVDAKRGDVGSTNDAYAEAYLGPHAPLGADALTVHPYLGLAAMGAFIDRAHEHGAGLLVVTRSSNPEGRWVQTARSGDHSTVEEGLLRDIGEINARLAPGRIGPLGAVIGPTPSGADLDLAAARALFLAPGVGAQGATVADVARCFEACPDRVLPSASRSLLAAGPESRSLRDAAARLADQLGQALGDR
ncbi:MAG: orotidine-5'-phosphate decarboxylase [Actinomycetota bacterium]|nr:orotidine-5'-phosphate decarboxylase [Actinomycetota bacterium]